MPPRTVKAVHDMEIDEISLVDRPANQHARLAIAKRHSPEDTMGFFDAEGNEVTEQDLQPGAVVYDDNGGTFLFDPNDEYDVDSLLEDDGADETNERVLADAGVSKAFAGTPAYQGPGLVEAVSKALEGVTTSSQREEVYKSALAAAERQAAQASEIAKSEREVRLTREYIAKAAEYNVPAAPDELGPVLMRMAVDPSTGEAWAAGTQGYADCAVIHKALTGASELITTEIGYAGGADNDDPFAKVEAMLDQQVAKGAGAVSKAAAVESYFDADPREYDAYRSLTGQR